MIVDSLGLHFVKVSIPLRYIRHKDDKFKVEVSLNVSIPLRYIRHDSVRVYGSDDSGSLFLLGTLGTTKLTFRIKLDP